MNVTGNGWQSIQSIRKRKLREKKKEVEFLLIKEDMMQDGISLPKLLFKNILSVVIGKFFSIFYKYFVVHILYLIKMFENFKHGYCI